MPADAFYEWQKLDAKNKQPFAIAMKDGQPYALAGLWEKWKDRKAGTELLTFTVITTDPNAVVEPLHNRMPEIVPERLIGNLIASVVNLPEQRSVFLRKWYREFHRKWVYTNTTS